MPDPVTSHEDQGDPEGRLIGIVSPLSLAVGRSKEGIVTICAATDAVKRQIEELLTDEDVDRYEVRVVGPIPALMDMEKAAPQRTTGGSYWPLGIDPADPQRAEKIATWYAEWSGVWDVDEALGWYERLRRSGPGEPDMWHNRWLADGP